MKSPNEVLTGSWDEFPYKNLPGKESPQYIEHGKIIEQSWPTGSPSEDFADAFD